MKTLKQLDDHSRYWLEKALGWADERFNEEYALVRMPLDRKHQGILDEVLGVRDSIWYATGLLMRQGEGDVDRALRIIETIMTYQFDEPEAVYHGTFFRYPGEPHPRNNTTIWRGYDPNWREFICTVFIILLREFDELLPKDLQEKMQHSILLAAQGSFARKVAAEYTNISLMSAFLLDYAGSQFNNEEWVTYALSQAYMIHNLFSRYKTFNEYNSPTYYGVDFFALALWREYGRTDVYRNLGAEMEADLWRDTAQFYHAGMKNICGAYDRSYGMDMTDYIAVVALWIATALPPEYAPLPDVDKPFEHAADYYFMPLVALVGTNPPADVMPHLTAFQGERILERIIEPSREVTAWLSHKLMLGAEADNLNTTRTDQFHPATAHWQLADGSIGWIRTRCDDLIQATAKPYELHLSSTKPIEYIFEVFVKNADASMIQANVWNLPELTVQLERADTPFTVKQEGDVLTVKFSGDAVKMTFAV